uniref:CPL domain-containing protein n=1 Tax=Otolemur garnettii TaxID=30611 RepID=H0XUC4_OTOGA
TEVKGKKQFTGKSSKASQEKKFNKINDSGSLKTFSRKVALEGGSKTTSKNLEKRTTKPGKGLKQVKNEQEGDEAPRNKFQQANKFSKKMKPRWDDFKEKKKELKRRRQLSDQTSYDLVRAKRIWEIFRKDCDKEKRGKLMNDSQTSIQGKMKTIASAHDSTGVIQGSTQYGNEEPKQALEELRDDLVELSKAQYSRNVAKKFLTYVSKPQIAEIIISFKHARKQLPHVKASAIVGLLERQSHFGAEDTLTRALADAFQIYKTAGHPTLEKTLEVQPEKLELIMDEMKQILTPMAQKEAVTHSLMHKLFLDFFFTYAPPKLRTEMTEPLVYLAHTHDGARVATHSCGLTPKNRKVIGKTKKTYAEKVANGQYSHLVLAGAFHCIDDTKLVKQIIMKMIGSLPNIVNDKYGRKVLLHLLSPRDPAHAVREMIEEDGNADSKKDTEITEFRRRELLESISPALLSYLQGMVLDKSACVLVPSVLRSATLEGQPDTSAIASLAAAELLPGGKDGEPRVAEHPAGRLVLKRLVEQDKEMKERRREGGCFAKATEHGGIKNLKSWANGNRGTIILSGRLQSSDPAVANKVKAGLTSLVPTLKKKQNTSKRIETLLEKTEC